MYSAGEDDTNQLVFIIGVLGVLLDQQGFRYALVAVQIVSIQDFAEVRLLDQRPVIVSDGEGHGAVLRGEDTDTILDCTVRLRHYRLDQCGVLGATNLRNQATNPVRHFLVAVSGHAADTIGNEHKYGRGSKPSFVHVLVDSAAIRGEGLHELGKFHN